MREKTITRKRRKNKRRIQKYIFWLILIGVCIISICYIKSNLSSWLNSAISDTFTFTDNSYKNQCPPELLEMAEKNPETLEFVQNYSKNSKKHHDIDLSSEITEGKIPLFMQWDYRWGYEYYGDDVMALNGCGPTCLSMVICGLSGEAEWTPLKVAKMAEENGYYVSGSGSTWSLMSEGATRLGLTVHKIRFEEDEIIKTLKKGRPIICIMGPGDFTTTGHFIVLKGVDKDGKILVCDPFRISNSEKAWDVETIMEQTRELWAYSY